MISVKQIEMSDSLYQQERALRNNVLLRPIGLPDHAWEMNDAGALHFIALEQNRVLGCVVLFPLDKEHHTVQLMQMAVDSKFQGKGIGKLLVDELIKFCASKKNQMLVKARECAKIENCLRPD